MLIGVGEILNKSWSNYQKNWRSFVPYIIGVFVPSLLVMIVGYLGVILDNRFDWTIFTSILTLVSMIAAALFAFWFGIAFAKALGASLKNEPIDDWKTGLKKSTTLIMPTVLTSLLVGIIVFAGTLLLVIPGMIFVGWYCFTFYIVIFENKKNSSALKASKDMVVGRWWSIIFRLVVPGIAFAIISGILKSVVTWPFFRMLDIYNAQIVANAIAAVVSAIFTPLLVGAQITLYFSAKENPVANVATLAEVK